MLRPRWKKMAGDIVHSQGRLVMMVAAIAVGVFAVTAISTAYAILSRELDRSYLATNPATASLELEPLDAAAVAAAKQQPGIAWAEAGGRIFGRVEVRTNEWLPLLLFVVPDFNNQRIGTVRLEAGRWPADAESIVLERTAAPVANTTMGQPIIVETPNGVPRSLHVTGIVHDPSLAPAWQQQTVYGYVTPAAVQLLGENADLHVLKLTVMDPAQGAAGIENTLVQTAGRLRSTGYRVGEIRIPPPHHPHHAQMTSVTRMLLAFSVLTLALGAILTATLTAGILAPQVRQIGVMKAIGATSCQIMALYAGLIAAIAAVAVALGLPVGIAGGRALALNVAHMLNLDLADLAVSRWLYIGQALAGVGLPLALALFPIMSATRRPVRELLNDYGARPPPLRVGTVAGWMSFVTSRDPALTLAIRNSVRRKLRLVLTLGLLAAAGALFMTSINVKAAWERGLAVAAAERPFDAEIQLVRPSPAAAVSAAVSAVPGVRRVELFSDEPAALARLDGLHIVRTFPDGGHGSLRVDALPWASAFVKPNVIEGRWLKPGDLDAAILNLQALPFFPGLAVGDTVHLIVRGHDMNLRVEGLVREHLTGATVYISSEAQARAMSEPGLTGGVRVALQSDSEESAVKSAAAIERSLESAGFKAAQSVSHAQLGRALAGHLYILIFVLIVMSILMAVVGILGLASTLATGVLERTREFAVMRAIGAGTPAILRTVIGEGVFIAASSVAAAVPICALLTIGVARIAGITTLGPALGMSAAAILLWLSMVLVGAAAASVYPAWTASKLTIRQALAYQ
jgi:putative ABC transport system permease protein